MHHPRRSWGFFLPYFSSHRTKSLLEIFYNLLTAPRTVYNTYAQVVGAQSCANHEQHIKRLSRASVMLSATWYEGTAQLLSLTEMKSHLFELYFIGRRRRRTIKAMKHYNVHVVSHRYDTTGPSGDRFPESPVL